MKITGRILYALPIHHVPTHGRRQLANGAAHAGSGCVVELHTDTELTGVTTGGGAALPIIESLVEGVLDRTRPKTRHRTLAAHGQ